MFLKDTPLPRPADPPIQIRRRYRAAHNVAHFRFVESTGLAADHTPRGEITSWEEVRFPLVPELRGDTLDGVEVARLAGPGDEVEERYSCDANGIIRVEMVNLNADYGDQFTLHGVE